MKNHRAIAGRHGGEPERDGHHLAQAAVITHEILYYANVKASASSKGFLHLEKKWSLNVQRDFCRKLHYYL